MLVSGRVIWIIKLMNIDIQLNQKKYWTCTAQWFHLWHVQKALLILPWGVMKILSGGPTTNCQTFWERTLIKWMLASKWDIWYVVYIYIPRESCTKNFWRQRNPWVRTVQFPKNGAASQTRRKGFSRTFDLMNEIKIWMFSRLGLKG